MREWLVKHKNEIIVGVVVSVLTTIVINLGGIVAKVIPSTGNSIVRAFRDSIYYIAGRQGVTSTPNTILVFLLSFLIVPTISGIITLYKETSTKALFSRTKEALIKKEEGTASKEEIDSVVRDLEKNLKKIERKKNKRPSVMKPILLSLPIIIFIVYTWCYMIYPASMWQEFENRIIQISPYIEESEVVLMRSKWVSMRTKEDFDEIDGYIHRIREEHNLP